MRRSIRRHGKTGAVNWNRNAETGPPRNLLAHSARQFPRLRGARLLRLSGRAWTLPAVLCGGAPRPGGDVWRRDRRSRAPARPWRRRGALSRRQPPPRPYVLGKGYFLKDGTHVPRHRQVQGKREVENAPLGRHRHRRADCSSRGPVYRAENPVGLLRDRASASAPAPQVVRGASSLGVRPAPITS
jgi:hypothetical protein